MGRPTRRPPFDPDYLRRELRYDTATGLPWWVSRRKKRRLDRPAGHIYTRKSDGKRYRVVMIDGRLYEFHMLAVYYMTGEWPDEVDHRDNDGTNNRWINLRPTTSAGNNQNRRLVPGRNKSGYIGVSWDKSRRQWRASLDGHTLGRFETREEAYEVYRKAAIAAYGEFAHSSLRSERGPTLNVIDDEAGGRFRANKIKRRKRKTD